MRVGKVIGSVTLSRAMAEVVAGRYLIIAPESLAALRGEGPAESDPVVAWDGTSAGCGTRVAFAEGREAAMPFHPRPVPIDVYCAAILDNLDIPAVSGGQVG